MSVRVKNIPAQIKEPDSANVEEFLVERYEKLIVKASLLTFLSKWVFMFVLVAAAIFYFVYKGDEHIIYYLIIPVIIGNILHAFTVWVLRSRESALENRISALEKEIFKTKLKKEFPHNEALKNQIEDFYIQLNGITHRRQLTYTILFPLDLGIFTLLYCLLVFSK